MTQNSKTIKEEAKLLDISDSYDVVVVGGGVAGVAAAVAASRTGAKTLLVEKEYALGGLATLGLVIDYLPLCDGCGKQVSFGLAEEMLLLTVKDGSAEVPECWLQNDINPTGSDSRYFLEYNAASVILLFEQFICDNGVSLLYDTRFSNVVKDESTIQAVILENKSGRFAVECQSVVDATGDADVCFAAGEPTISLSTNTACGWFYATSDKGNELFKLYKPFDPEGKIIPENGGKGYRGDDGRSVTDLLRDSRNMIREHLEMVRDRRKNEKIYPFLIPTFPGFRMTRCILGKTTFRAEDRKEYSDSIGLIGDWRKRGPVYSIPFDSLCTISTNNLFAAGRCISAKGYGWDQSRVIPACAVTGQAAGTAAAISNRKEVNLQELQSRLRQNRVKLYFDEIQ